MLPTSLMWVSWGENSQEAAPSCVGIGHHLQEHLVAHRNKGSWLERPTEATESLPIGMATVNIHIVVAAQVVVLQVNKAEWQDHHLSLRHLSGETPLDYWKIIYDYTGTILLLKQFKGNISNICYDYICSSSILMFTFRGHCTWNKASCKNCLQLAVAVVFLEGNWEFGVSEWVAQSCCFNKQFFFQCHSIFLGYSCNIMLDSLWFSTHIWCLEGKLLGSPGSRLFQTHLWCYHRK